jgi:hypothetical protein
VKLDQCASRDIWTGKSFELFHHYQPGCSSGYAIRPTTAVAGINSGAVSQSPMAMRPSRMQAPRIVPIAAARFAGRRTAIAAARSRSLSVDLGQDRLEIAKIDIKSTQSGSESN